MRISESDIARLARLAQLELDPAELHNVTRDLDAILAYVERLDPEGAASSEDATSSTPLRDDVPALPMSSARAVSIAPDRQSELFKVPPVLGGERAKA